ncbi:MAG: 2-phospho-L-lactate transferase [Jiangellaceae bacterium]
MLVALAGGVGASKFLRGLMTVHDPRDVTVIVNTGDDIQMHGLNVSPDLDSVVYRLAGVGDDDRGWGRAEETWNVRDTLISLGEPGWYNLGDRDIASQLLRTRLMNSGLRLSEATAELCRRLGVAATVLPMTDDIVQTRVEVEGPDGAVDLGFQEYWVARRAQDPVIRITFDGIDTAEPAPGVIEAVRECDGVIFCPSNPIVSILPILSVKPIREALLSSACPKIAVTPIIAGDVVRGMADKLLPARGVEVSARGVAGLYADLIDYFVLDQRDAGQTPEVAAMGVKPVVAQTLMTSQADERDLARTVIEALRGR